MKPKTPTEEISDRAREVLKTWALTSTPKQMAREIGCGEAYLVRLLDGENMTRLSAKSILSAYKART